MMKTRQLEAVNDRMNRKERIRRMNGDSGEKQLLGVVVESAQFLVVDSLAS
jgi:hypothetical protein